MRALGVVCFGIVVGCAAARGGAPTSSEVDAGAPLATAKPAATPAQPSAAAESEPVSPFQLIAEHDQEALLHALGDRGFVSVRQQLFAIDEHGLRADPALQVGLPTPEGGWTISHIAGKWPDNAWLATTELAGHGSRDTLYRWRRDRWQLVRSTAVDKKFAWLTTWSTGGLLALVESMVDSDASFLVISGPRNLPALSFTKAKPRVSFCVSKLEPQAFAALDSGHVLVGGQVCEAKGVNAEVIGAGVERWDPARKRSVIDPLPGMEVGPRYDGVSVNSLVAVSPNEIYATTERSINAEGSPRVFQLLRFDGTLWQVEPMPTRRGIRRLWLAADKTLWASDGEGQPWKRPHGGTWLSVPLPTSLPPADTARVWQRAEGDVWAVAESRERNFVLHTRPKVDG